MEVEVNKNLNKAEAEIRVRVKREEFSPYLEKAAARLSKENSVPGFRPGKAPVKVAAEVLGEQRLLNKAADKAVTHFFVQAVLDNSIDAIARPSITINKLGLEEDLEFTATAAVLPEVKLGDISSITAEKKKVSVSDKEVEKELDYLARKRSSWLAVARAAQKGDTVTADFKILMNGEVIEGGESKNHPVHLGEGHLVEDFEKKLEGIKAGESRQFTIEFPPGFAKEHLRGKKAQAQVKAHAVQKRVVPEINDAFARQGGDFKDLNTLKYVLKSNLIQEKEQKEKERLRSELTTKLAQMAEFTPIHEALIEKEIDRMIKEMERMLSLQQKTLDEYLAAKGKKLEEVRANMREGARKSIQIGLALRQFAKEQNIKVEEEEIEEKLNEYLRQFTSPEQASQEVDQQELKENISYMLRNQKALDKLEESANVIEAKSGPAE